MLGRDLVIGYVTHIRSGNATQYFVLSTRKRIKPHNVSCEFSLIKFGVRISFSSDKTSFRYYQWSDYFLSWSFIIPAEVVSFPEPEENSGTPGDVSPKSVTFNVEVVAHILQKSADIIIMSWFWIQEEVHMRSVSLESNDISEDEPKVESIFFVIKPSLKIQNDSGELFEISSTS